LKLEEIRRQLDRILGPENVSDADVDRYCYSGAPPSRLPRLLGKMAPEVIPDFVVWPTSTSQVVELVKLANKSKTPLIPWGGGRGGCGGVTSVKRGSVVVDMRKMDRVLEANEEGAFVTVQAGAYPEVIDSIIIPKGFFLPHDPASYWSSTIGGFLSTASAGWLAPKYGYIGDMVLSLEVVLPNGEVLRTRKAMKSSAGPNWNWLFVGAGGTLGIITEATLKIHPLPEERRIRILRFDDVHSAFRVAFDLARKNLNHCMLRVSDPDHARGLASVLGTPDPKGAWLIYGFDGPSELVEAQDRLALKIVSDGGGEDMGTEVGRTWWKKRYDYFYGKRPEYRTKAQDVLTTATTFDRIDRVYNGLKETFRKHGSNSAIHLTHILPKGAAMYCIFEFPYSEEGLKLDREIWDDGIRFVHSQGATMEHHHEIGLKLAKYMGEELGYGMEVFRMVKRAFDPNNIMNPGKLGL
jgi:alkyldihydroxyacetonephosphate synthase